MTDSKFNFFVDDDGGRVTSERQQEVNESIL